MIDGFCSELQVPGFDQAHILDGDVIASQWNNTQNHTELEA
jgi:hypothetical protein